MTLAGLAIIIAVFILIMPFASQEPDGFDHAAEQLTGGQVEESEALLSAPFDGYSVEGMEEQAVGSWIAGTVGILTVFLLSLGLGMILRKRGNNHAA